VLTFQRWRLDGPKAWAALEQCFRDLSPRSLEGLDLLFDAVGARAREREPGYDFKRALLGNLGDDFITLTKPPRDSAAVGAGSSPSLLLIGSPDPAQLAGALKALFAVLPGADAATEREFLGRKVCSIPLPPNLSLSPLGSSGRSAPATLHYAASHDYVALSTDALLVEDYLRGSQGQGRALRDALGLTEAAQKVVGPGTDLFGYENLAELVRARYEALRQAAPAPSPSAEPAPWPSPPGAADQERSPSEWMDFSLLPPFDKLAKYFHFAVYGGSVTVEGLTYQLFLPTPPGTRK
jgi:hypothetical protein